MAALRVLVVDDEQLAREELCFLLGHVGGVDILAEAADGVGALRLAGELRPDVLFLDVQMPGLNGFEVARRLMEAEVLPQLVFVRVRPICD
jgi:CheY-like chemotaxis protein